MIVIDTHILIWLSLTPERITAPAQQAIADANSADGIIIADITLWEVAMLVQKGRVQIPTNCTTFLNLALQAYDIHVQPITPRIATRSTQLPQTINKDPTDRLIVATALAQNASLVTADRNLRADAAVVTIW